MGVSLVIPNYNNAPFLRQCLESAIGQTVPFEEIIVVDDASEDDSRDVVESFVARCRNVRLLALPRRGGVSRARNAGMQAAQGSHVSTLDSDDFLWHREKNERECALLRAGTATGRPLIAFSGIRRVSVRGEDRGSVAIRRRIKEGDVFRWLLLLRGFVPRDFTLARDVYFAVGGYDAGFDLYEDWDLKLRLARIGDFRFSGIDGVAYRENPKGLSRAALGRHLGAMSRVIFKNTTHLTQPSRLLTRCHALSRAGWYHRGGVKTLLFGHRRLRTA